MHSKSHSVDGTSSNKTSSTDISSTKPRPRRIIRPMWRLLLHNISKIDKTPPYATSKSWVMYDQSSKKLLCSKLSTSKREIASLTKIMVLYTWIKICKRYGVKEDEEVEIPSRVAKIVGTSAKLKEDDVLKIIDLYYALMLPSGNDAGYTLAQHFGEKLLAENVWREDQEVKFRDLKSTFNWPPRVLAFLKEMNFYCNKLGMKNTLYDSPHGLANPFNISTAGDQGLLISHWYNEPTFVKVVNTKKYAWKGLNKSYVWENTNKLLQKGFLGAKTGITEPAGPCLAVAKRKNILGKEITIILVLLSWKSLDERWKEAPKLMKWWFKKINEQFLKN